MKTDTARVFFPIIQLQEVAPIGGRTPSGQIAPESLHQFNLQWGPGFYLREYGSGYTLICFEGKTWPVEESVAEIKALVEKETRRMQEGG